MVHSSATMMQRTSRKKSYPCILCCAAEIGIFDGFVVVYRFISDLHFFVTGSEDENELILDSVLEAFFEAVAQLLR